MKTFLLATLISGAANVTQPVLADSLQEFAALNASGRYDHLSTRRSEHEHKLPDTFSILRCDNGSTRVDWFPDGDPGLRVTQRLENDGTPTPRTGQHVCTLFFD